MKSWFLAATGALAISLAFTGWAHGGGASTLAPSSVAPASVAPASVAPSTPSPSAEASPSAANAIVGEWVGVHDCERIVAMLGDASLDEFLADAVYGNELVPGVDPRTATLKDPSKPCDGAVERQRSHFFTAAGSKGRKTSAGSGSTRGPIRSRATTASSSTARTSRTRSRVTSYRSNPSLSTYRHARRRTAVSSRPGC